MTVQESLNLSEIITEYRKLLAQYNTNTGLVERWNVTKKQVIIRMAELKEQLFHIENKSKGDIASAIISDLEVLGFKSDSEKAYIYKVLAPLGYTQESFVLKDLSQEVSATVTKVDLDTIAVDINRIKKLSPEAYKLWKQHEKDKLNELKHRYREIKNIQETVESENNDIFIDNETKLEFSLPPKELHRESESWQTLGRLVEKTRKIADMYAKIQEDLYKNPPQSKALDKEINDKLKTKEVIECDYPMTILSTFADKKMADIYPSYLDYLKTWFDKSYGATKVEHAIMTGEYEYVTRDGTKIVIPLFQQVTTEHLKERLPEILDSLKYGILFKWYYEGFEQWINEQYSIIGDIDSNIAKVYNEFRSIRIRDNEKKPVSKTKKKNFLNAMVVNPLTFRAFNRKYKYNGVAQNING